MTNKSDDKKKYTLQQDELARFAKAMGHPARIAILEFLASQDSCFFGEIHEVLPIAKATVSQHLKELKNAHLIKGEIEMPKVRYCIDKEHWAYAQQIFSKFFLNKKSSCGTSCSTNSSTHTDPCCETPIEPKG